MANVETEEEEVRLLKLFFTEANQYIINVNRTLWSTKFKTFHIAFSDWRVSKGYTGAHRYDLKYRLSDLRYKVTEADENQKPKTNYALIWGMILAKDIEELDEREEERRIAKETKNGELEKNPKKIKPREPKKKGYRAMAPVIKCTSPSIVRFSTKRKSPSRPSKRDKEEESSESQQSQDSERDKPKQIKVSLNLSKESKPPELPIVIDDSDVIQEEPFELASDFDVQEKEKDASKDSTISIESGSSEDSFDRNEEIEKEDERLRLMVEKLNQYIEVCKELKSMDVDEAIVQIFATRQVPAFEGCLDATIEVIVPIIEGIDKILEAYRKETATQPEVLSQQT